MKQDRLNQALVDSGLFRYILDDPVPGLQKLNNAERAREVHSRAKDMIISAGDDDNSGAVPVLMITFEASANSSNTFAMVPNMDHREYIFELLREANKHTDSGVEQVTLVTTAWVGSIQGKDPSTLPAGYRPSTDPGRQEALITYSQDADGMKYIYVDKLVRDESGKVITFENSIIPSMDDSDRFESPVFDLGSWRKTGAPASWH